MTKRLFFPGMALLAAALAALGADAITGKWTLTQEFNGNSFTTTFDLKADGAKLTGTANVPGFGQDAQPSAIPIANGKVDGNNLSFEVTREMMGNSFTTKYEGTVSGDQMQLKITFPGFQGGGPMTFDGVAKRSGT
jgi:hypothetical protein